MPLSSSLLQGSVLPSTTSTTQTQAVAPEFYTNYLQDIANLGQSAVTQGGVAGLSPLQKQALEMAPTAAFSGADTAGAASKMLQTAGSTTAPGVVQNYMNPYQSNVVDEMGRLSNLNVQRNILPALKAAGVSSGGLGSTRMANVTGQTLADIQAALTGQQFGALNQGYKDAISAAQTDLSRGVTAGQGLTSTANTQSNIGLSGLKNLSELGAMEQAQGQKLLDQPMDVAQKFAKLMQGYTIPTGTTTQTVKPGEEGQFSNSTLSQITGLLAALGSLSGGSGDNTGGGTSILNQILSAFGIDFANGGSVKMADGGAVTGGLQSMIQGTAPNVNYNIPRANNSINGNIPNIGMNPPALNIRNLDYQTDPNAFNLNRSTMNGTPPNTSLMVG